MTTYTVKTRNWHTRRAIFILLGLTQAIGVQRGDSYDDGDGKFWLETSNPIKAWAVWTFFMILRPLSGGWTYIVRPMHKLGDGYRSIY